MSFDKVQFTELIIDTLVKLNKCSVDAVNLLLGTCAVESNFGAYLKQIGGGPAHGIFQMELNTERDIWLNYIYYNEDLTKIIYDICKVIEPDKYQLRANLPYQIIMARCHYLRVAEALPTTIQGYAKYWKKYYNTVKGKGTEEKFIANYNRYILNGN